MLNLYRRHQAPCRFTSRRYRNCKCPIWVQGSLRGEYIRRALNLRSWSAATDLVRDWEAAGEIGVVKRVEVPNVAEAVEKFFVDANIRVGDAVAVFAQGPIGLCAAVGAKLGLFRQARGTV